MSQETMEWLNKNTLIGFTDKRGHNAWHYRADLQGDEPNHYPGAIPVDDVLKRLFSWEAVEQPIYVKMGENWKEIDDRKAIVASDNGDVLGIFKQGYTPHQYKDWLLDNVANLLDDELGIGSAGLLRNRGQAWVSVEVPESIVTKEGVEFRPNLMATTSFDGTLATTYKRIFTIVVCDNTRAQALGEAGQEFKIKHSKYSQMKLQSARDALNIVHTMSESFSEEIAELTKWKVTDKQFEQLLDLCIPVPDENEEGSSKRGITVAEKKRAEILSLYNNDERCAPWKGNAFGVLQSYNTHLHHFSQVRKGVPRVIRNMENAVSDRTAAHDKVLLERLATVTGK